MRCGVRLAVGSRRLASWDSILLTGLAAAGFVVGFSALVHGLLAKPAELWSSCLAAVGVMPFISLVASDLDGPTEIRDAMWASWIYPPRRRRMEVDAWDNSPAFSPFPVNRTAPTTLRQRDRNERSKHVRGRLGCDKGNRAHEAVDVVFAGGEEQGVGVAGALIAP